VGNDDRDEELFVEGEDTDGPEELGTKPKLGVT
jgi:hypothetical protein